MGNEVAVKKGRDSFMSKCSRPGLELASLPEENPFPVLRLATDGILLYANPAAASLLENWRCCAGELVPEFLRTAAADALAVGELRQLEVVCGERVLCFAVVPIRAHGHVNFYSRDVTEQKQAAESLTRLNRELEGRVADRTAELTSANALLQREMAERARAQAAQAANEARFRSLVEATPDWIWEVDETGRYTYVSPAVRQLLGYEPEELLGKSCFDFMPPAEAERVKPIFSSLAAETGQIVTVENVNLHRDGHKVILESTGAPFFADDGRLLGYRGVDRDVTERRKVADQVLQAKNEWQETFDAIAAPIMLLDKNFRILRANQAMAGKLGMSPAEVVGATCYELVHGSETPHCDCPHARLLADGQRHQSEVCEDRLGGWYQISVDPLREADGRVRGSIHYGEDITARIENAAAMRLNAVRLEEAQRLAHLGHWELDIRQNLLVVSSEVCHIYDLAPGEFPANLEAILAMVHPEERKAVEKAYAESVRNHTDYDSKHRLLLKNGVIKHVHERCVTSYDDLGEPLLSLGTVQDISRQTSLESQLRQAQKMEAIGTLAGGIAHDFNNILTAILGYGEIVLESLPAGSALREEQEQVVLAGNRAKELVKQILTFSRAGEQELKPLLIQFVIKEALKLMRASLPTTITIRSNIDTGCGPVLADPSQIHQVVMNLCTNAYHAMRESGGILTVSLATVSLSKAEAASRGNLAPGHYAVLEVSDTGCGMDKAVQERIFDPYFTTKSKGEGTGLGLAMVRGIAMHLHGEASVSSEPGRGATFKILLPLIKTKAHDERLAKSEPLPRGEARIIAVDDDVVIVRLEREILESLGYRVTTFADSARALQALRDSPEDFDLLLTDMTMPKLTGAQLAMEVLRLRPEMPIILCTGFSELIDAQKAKSLGIREFILKPVDKGELAKAVRRALAGPPVTFPVAHE
ncbi:MAG: PAS domain-containing protein [Desulfobulbaceae bacterium]|nr:PAS domain-containing protein [Desulfobulbaceae bacterium]